MYYSFHEQGFEGESDKISSLPFPLQHYNLEEEGRKYKYFLKQIRMW